VVMRLGTAYDGAIVITSWICVTLIVALVLWMIQPEYLDWASYSSFGFSMEYPLFSPSDTDCLGENDSQAMSKTTTWRI
jgi:hypothetical protein